MTIMSVMRTTQKKQSDATADHNAEANQRIHSQEKCGDVNHALSSHPMMVIVKFTFPPSE